MTRQIEAVYEEGVLRPLEPLSLSEKQHVLVTIADVPEPEEINHRYAEQEWLNAHEAEYRSSWVALDGNRLVSHGPRAVPVRDEARRQGVQRPLMVHISEDFGLPSAGLLQL